MLEKEEKVEKEKTGGGACAAINREIQETQRKARKDESSELVMQPTAPCRSEQSQDITNKGVSESESNTNSNHAKDSAGALIQISIVQADHSAATGIANHSAASGIVKDSGTTETAKDSLVTLNDSEQSVIAEHAKPVTTKASSEGSSVIQGIPSVKTNKALPEQPHLTLFKPELEGGVQDLTPDLPEKKVQDLTHDLPEENVQDLTHDLHEGKLQDLTHDLPAREDQDLTHDLPESEDTSSEQVLYVEYEDGKYVKLPLSDTVVMERSEQQEMQVVTQEVEVIQVQENVGHKVITQGQAVTGSTNDAQLFIESVNEDVLPESHPEFSTDVLIHVHTLLKK